MIALIASAVLGLYVFLPDFIFNRIAAQFVRLKKRDRTRIEDLGSGLVVVLIPFVLTLWLSHSFWLVGHWPMAIDESVQAKFSDYKIFASSLYSDAFFEKHYDAFWSAFPHVWRHQLRFLIWNYIFLILESYAVSFLTSRYGSLRKYPIYQRTVGKYLLGRASEWYVLLSAFSFPPGNKPRIFVDVMTSDDHLYDGELGDYFLDSGGNLSGLLIKNVRRFRYEEYRKLKTQTGRPATKDEFWSVIPSGNFLLPADKIANLNIRYVSTSGLIESLMLALREGGISTSPTLQVILKNPDNSPEPKP